MGTAVRSRGLIEVEDDEGGWGPKSLDLVPEVCRRAAKSPVGYLASCAGAAWLPIEGAFNFEPSFHLNHFGIL